MKPISIWYHIRLFGNQPPTINPDYSISLMMEQMETLKSSGLLDAAEDLTVCVNGDSENILAAMSLAPENSRFVNNGPGAQGLLATVNALRKWSIDNPNRMVCFFHAKGLTHPGDDFCIRWRKCMEKHVIKNWRTCAEHVDSGVDTVGAHWLTKEKYGNSVTFPFWGGQFFWANTSFLAELPAIPNNPTCPDDWYLSERWIGMGRPPVVIDYAPHWPGPLCCG